ncbi:hypothetical protein V6N11_045548 [Hibiscus sabdariffa]|uniref:DUF4216 domain-containing protein n=1 Tax=Hibiscus sabdariffa TaxID=183260 RepID=A0ABR2Q1B0_9ROSI
MMQWYILTNCDEVEPYMEKHKMEIQLQNALSIEERHRAEFPLWFRNYVSNQDSKEVSDELLSLAYGPDKRAQKYTVQAKQVFYLDDTKLGKDWRVVQKFHHRHLYDVPEMQVVENDEVSDVDEEFETYDCNAEMPISESTSLHRDDIVANTINCEIVGNVDVLIDSDQESGDDNEGDEIELDEYDTDIEHIL